MRFNVHGLLAILMLAVAVIFAPAPAMAGDDGTSAFDAFTWNDYTLAGSPVMPSMAVDGRAVGVSKVIPFANLSVKGRPLMNYTFSGGPAAVVSDGPAGDAGYKLSFGFGMSTPNNVAAVNRVRMFGEHGGWATMLMYNANDLPSFTRVGGKDGP